MTEEEILQSLQTEYPEFSEMAEAMFWEGESLEEIISLLESLR